ncbi:unnamed protein product [Leptosia nina]|uniref:PHD-type domain-containing protein n=1 Tax=Leptosia nina TaxID=320188 RepID=A0AAV1JJ29_9NEOP
MLCKACNCAVSINEILKCSHCAEIFHHGCVNITPKKYKKFLASGARQWICPICDIKYKYLKGDNTPVRSQVTRIQLSADQTESNTPSGSPPLPPARLDVSTMSIEDSHVVDISCNQQDVISFDKFSALIDQKLEGIKYSLINEIETRLHTIKSSLMSDITSKMKDECASVTQALKDDLNRTTEYLVGEQKDLRKALETAEERIVALEKDKLESESLFKNMRRQMDALDKASRSRNLEIQCIPQKRNENLIFIFKSLCDLIGHPMSEGDISSIKRVASLNPNSERPRNIIVSLPSTRHRDSIISAFKNYNKKNPVTSVHLHIPGPANRLFIAEHHSSTCKAIFAAARKACKEKKYKYCWVKDERVYVRKEDGGVPFILG